MIVGQKYDVTVANFTKDGIRYHVPVYNNLHDDKESLQVKKHFHVDFRFIKQDRKWFWKHLITRIYPGDHKDFYLSVEPRRMYSIDHRFTTDSTIIEKSILNLENLKQFRCAHKGYDLTDLDWDGLGCVTCPLHGMKYKMEKNKLVMV